MTTERPERDPWSCPRCGRTFASTGQVHRCVPLGDLETRLAGASPAVRATFDAVVEAVTALGPVEVLPQRARIAARSICAADGTRKGSGGGSSGRHQVDNGQRW